MPDKVLITGGAGFVGSHLTDELLAAGYAVRILDSLEPQVYGGEFPAYLTREAEMIVGSVLDRDALKGALAGVRWVVHLAAAVGVGQSMYEIARYNAVNTQGTAELLQAILESRQGQEFSVERLIVASSMSIYGEGRYRCGNCGAADVERRGSEQLRQQRWEVYCPRCGSVLEPLPTDEAKPLHLHSIYALTKYVQEEMVLLFGRTYGIPSVALRFFNIYGPRQSLSNPYTGVAAIFAARLLEGAPPQVFEDGAQRRDFVSVHDVARACRLALERGDASDVALNIGSGHPVSIAAIAHELARALGSDIEPEIIHQYRLGDIRNCFADISRAQALLGYQPQITLEEGLKEFVDWLREQAPRAAERHQATARGARASAELAAFGLIG